jgi:NAD(P)-dependent dehydrogenase (short-subunit alcohol dehydrogenase family)
MTKTWFITGTSKGFGREWAEGALERGDKVAATARNVQDLDALIDTYGDAVLPIQLDVTDRRADFDAVKRAATTSASSTSSSTTPATATSA